MEELANFLGLRCIFAKCKAREQSEPPTRGFTIKLTGIYKNVTSLDQIIIKWGFCPFFSPMSTRINLLALLLLMLLVFYQYKGIRSYVNWLGSGMNR